MNRRLMAAIAAATSVCLVSVAIAKNVQSTDANGNCPSGYKKIDECHGTYANGSTWKITPCCSSEKGVIPVDKLRAKKPEIKGDLTVAPTASPATKSLDKKSGASTQ